MEFESTGPGMYLVCQGSEKGGKKDHIKHAPVLINHMHRENNEILAQPAAANFFV